MTPAELEAIRGRVESLDARYSDHAWEGYDFGAVSDRRALLEHVDELEERLRAQPPRYCDTCGDETGVDHRVRRLSQRLDEERSDRMVHARNVGRLTMMHFAARHLLAWQQARALNEIATRDWAFTLVDSDERTLRAENQRLREVLRQVQEAPDGWDGAILPLWLERAVAAALGEDVRDES